MPKQRTITSGRKVDSKSTNDYQEVGNIKKDMKTMKKKNKKQKWTKNYKM